MGASRLCGRVWYELGLNPALNEHDVILWRRSQLHCFLLCELGKALTSSWAVKWRSQSSRFHEIKCMPLGGSGTLAGEGPPDTLLLFYTEADRPHVQPWELPPSQKYCQTEPGCAITGDQCPEDLLLSESVNCSDFSFPLDCGCQVAQRDHGHLAISFSSAL